MICPLCNYSMDSFDKECPRCHGKGAPPPAASTPAAAPPVESTATVAPTTANPTLNPFQACGCIAAFVFFVVLPFNCIINRPSNSSRSRSYDRTPTYTAPPVTQPTPVAPYSAPRVWVNLETGVYHYPTGRWYGKTAKGAYMTEA